jgi:hypothetical protein
MLKVIYNLNILNIIMISQLKLTTFLIVLFSTIMITSPALFGESSELNHFFKGLLECLD